MEAFILSHLPSNYWLRFCVVYGSLLAIGMPFLVGGWVYDNPGIAIAGGLWCASMAFAAIACLWVDSDS